MSKELYVLFGTLLGLIVAYITAKINSKTQIQITELNIRKELALQEIKILDERLKKEVALERGRLEELHMILSKIALENSRTMSYIQSDSNLELAKFRERYIDNCERLHKAEAIVDLYYSEMSDAVKRIYGPSNVFWGHQEGVLRTDIKTNEKGYRTNLGQVIEAGDEISSLVGNLQQKILYRGEELNNKLSRSLNASGDF